jgi:hypothetical protein
MNFTARPHRNQLSFQSACPGQDKKITSDSTGSLPRRWHIQISKLQEFSE